LLFVSPEQLLDASFSLSVLLIGSESDQNDLGKFLAKEA